MNCAVLFLFLWMALVAVANPMLAKPLPPHREGGTVQENLTEKNYTVNDFIQIVGESITADRWCNVLSRDTICYFERSNDYKPQECWEIFKPRFINEFTEKNCPRNYSRIESLYDELLFSINCTKRVNSTSAWELKLTNETLGKESLVICLEEVFPTTTSTSTEPSTIPSTTPTSISTPEETKATEKNVTVVPAVCAEAGDGHLYWSMPLVAIVLIVMAVGGYGIYRKTKQGGYRTSASGKKFSNSSISFHHPFWSKGRDRGTAELLQYTECIDSSWQHFSLCSKEAKTSTGPI